MTNPRREWTSLRWVRRWSVTWRMRSVSIATCNSVEPVSVSWVRYSSRTLCLTSGSNITDCLPYLCGPHARYASTRLCGNRVARYPKLGKPGTISYVSQSTMRGIANSRLLQNHGVAPMVGRLRESDRHIVFAVVRQVRNRGPPCCCVSILSVSSLQTPSIISHAKHLSCRWNQTYHFCLESEA